MKTIHAYHFTTDTLRDGTPIPPTGEWLEHSGPIIPCKAGLHASEHPFDALTYAPGPRLHRVELRGDIQTHGDPADKLVARSRRIVSSIDATDILRGFARWNARQCIDKWDAPQVVRDYLETGDPNLRPAAEFAARSAAWSAAWSAARSAAWSAARSAARSTAESAARSAAESAAWSAARARFALLVNAAPFDS